MAVRMHVPIVPVYIPRDKKIFHEVPTVIGEPYYPELGDHTRNLLLQVNDKRLLEQTGGIVQGMGVIDNMDNTKKPRNTELLAVTLTMNRISVSDQHRHIKMDVALA